MLSYGIVIAACVILGFIIYFKNRKSATNVLFLVLTIISSAWSILNYLAYQIVDPTMSLWIVRVVMFLAVYQAFSFFLLMYAFPKRELALPKLFKLLAIPIIFIVSVLTLTPFVFPKVNVIVGQAPEPVAGAPRVAPPEPGLRGAV